MNLQAMTKGRTAGAITNGDKFASSRLRSSDCRHWTEVIGDQPKFKY